MNGLEKAIENNELILFYQPWFDVKTNKMLGVEALLRWRHPIKGLISPGHFIPIAEKTGSILPIGDWVLMNACKQLKSWHDQGFCDVDISVNLSPSQLKYGDIVKSVDSALQSSKLSPQFLSLEITEQIRLEDNVKLRKTILAFKERGITLAIDDFGAGYSNVNYLTRFPIDKLKIDKSFIQEVTSNRSKARLVLSIIGVARDFNMTVLAEGVETQEQLQFLKENQCDEFQGFLISQPVDSIAFGKLLTFFHNLKG